MLNSNNMKDEYIQPRRSMPHYAAEQRGFAAKDALEIQGIQQDAGASNDLQRKALPSPEDFTISVEQVREHFRSKGLTKSKDTVQRWCRNGDLTCQKRGVLGRYFTTETSLLELERKLLPDMIAENAGAISSIKTEVQPHAAEVAPDRSGLQVDAAEDANAYSSIQEQVQVDAPAHSGDTNPEVARLSAEVIGLNAQLKNRDSQIEFLQEEIRSGREQRGAVVQISNRMLETLETMAIGGRLERSNQQGSQQQRTHEPVHVEHRDPPRNGV